MSIAQNFPEIRPSLNLDFANVKALDPRVTFARASGATYYGTETAKAEENLLIRSQDFAFGASSVTGWNKTRATVGSAVTAPNGTTTAEPVTQTAGQTISGFVSQTVSVTANDYVASVFAKPNGKNFLRFAEEIGTGTARISWIDLSTGTAGTTNAGHTITIEATTEGFYRVSVVFAVNATRSGLVFFSLADTDNSTVVVDSGGLILWGCQLEQRDAVTAYTPTTTQPITRFQPVLESEPAGVARFDHNPITFESLGLLVEQQRTNLFQRSEEYDNAYWQKTRLNIIANTIVAPDGTLTADKLVETTETGFKVVRNTVIAIASGVAHTPSVYLKAAGRTQARISFTTAFNGQAAVVDLVSATVISGDANIEQVGNGWLRVSATQTSTATSALIDIGPALNGSGSYTGDGFSGLFIWGAQLEAGAFPTSYIKTVASQVTRSSDNASMTGANFSSWYNQAESTLFSDFVVLSPITPAARATVSINDNTSNNRFTSIVIESVGANFRALRNTAGAGLVFSPAPSNLANNTITGNKMALAVANYDVAMCGNGGTVATATTYQVPVVNQMQIGNQLNGSFLNGYLRKLAYYPQRLTNAQLQALTG